MQQFTPDELPVGKPLTQHLYHRTGVLLFRAGQTLRPDHMLALRAGGVHTVYAAANAEELRQLKVQTGLQMIDIAALPVGHALEHDICERTGVVLLSRGNTFRTDHRDALFRRGHQHVWMPNRSAVAELRMYEHERTRRSLALLDARIDADGEGMKITPDYPPFLHKVVRVIERTREERAATMQLRERGGRHAREMLSGLAEGQDPGDQVQQIVHDSLGELARDANLLLNLSSLVAADPREEDPRADHLVNVCMTALSIGAYLNYDAKRLHDLGVCAFLHDVGMVRVPREILLKPGPLTPAELLEVQQHPTHGVNLLEHIKGTETGTFLGVYQSHERLDGRGYPKGRKPPFIHEFAQIIAVADTFAAMRSPRPFRAARLPYEAMETVVRMAGQKAVDPRIVRALLHSVGLYPIGSWVMLSTGETARVVGTAGQADKYDRPTVATFFAANGNRYPTPRITDLLARLDVKVVQALPNEQFDNDPLLGF